MKKPNMRKLAEGLETEGALSLNELLRALTKKCAGIDKRLRVPAGTANAVVLEHFKNTLRDVISLELDLECAWDEIHEE